MQQLGLDEGPDQGEDGGEKHERLPIHVADHRADRLDAHAVDHEQRQRRDDDRDLGRDDAVRQGLPDQEQDHHDQEHEQRQHQEGGPLDGDLRTLGRQGHPRRPDLRQQPGQQRHDRQHGQQTAQAHHPQIIGERQPDRAADQKGRGVAHQGQHAGRVTDDGGDDQRSDKIHLERLADADDDRGHQDDGGRVGQHGAHRRDQRDDQQQKPLAAAAGGAEERLPDPVEDPGLADHPRHHHAAEEQGKRTAGGVDDRHQIAAVEDAEHDQDADPEQGGDRHIDQVERDQEDHGDENADGEINLKVGHPGVTQSIGGA